MFLSIIENHRISQGLDFQKESDKFDLDEFETKQKSDKSTNKYL